MYSNLASYECALSQVKCVVSSGFLLNFYARVLHKVRWQKVCIRNCPKSCSHWDNGHRTTDHSADQSLNCEGHIALPVIVDWFFWSLNSPTVKAVGSNRPLWCCSVCLITQYKWLHGATISFFFFLVSFVYGRDGAIKLTFWSNNFVEPVIKAISFFYTSR